MVFKGLMCELECQTLNEQGQDITSLQHTVGEQADQIEALAAELELNQKAREAYKHAMVEAEQQLTESQTDLANVRAALAEQEDVTDQWQKAAKMNQVLENLQRAEAAEAKLEQANVESKGNWVELVRFRAMTEAAKYKLAESQAKEAALRQALGQIDAIGSALPTTADRDRLAGDFVDMWLLATNALAAPSAEAERVQLLEAEHRAGLELARCCDETTSGVGDFETACLTQGIAYNGWRAALTALDAATGEEVKGDEERLTS